MLIHDNIDQLVAYFLLGVAVLIVTSVFARNIIAQARKNATVRMMRREHQKKVTTSQMQSTRMWKMLEDQ